MGEGRDTSTYGQSIKIHYNAGEDCIEVPLSQKGKVFDYKKMPVKEISEVEEIFKGIFPLIRGKNTVSILVDDHTRPTPISDILPHLFNILEVGRVKERRIIVAFGTHNHPEEEWLRKKLGDGVMEDEIVILHDAFDEKENVYVGTTSSGNEVYLNRWAVQSDFKIGIGSVFSSEIAGFTGGPKIVLPGIAGVDTIEYNHAFFLKKDIRAGFYEGNPIPEDMAEAARLLPIDWILDLVMTPDGVVDFFYGDFEEFHPRARSLVREIYSVPVVKTGSLVVGCGMTEDVDFVQAVKALFVANEFTVDGGEIYFIAGCPLGLNWEELIDTIGGGEVEEFARAVYERLSPLFNGNKSVYMLTNSNNFSWVEELGFIPIEDLKNLTKIEDYNIMPVGALIIPEI